MRGLLRGSGVVGDAGRVQEGGHRLLRLERGLERVLGRVWALQHLRGYMTRGHCHLWRLPEGAQMARVWSYCDGSCAQEGLESLQSGCALCGMEPEVRRRGQPRDQSCTCTMLTSKTSPGEHDRHNAVYKNFASHSGARSLVPAVRVVTCFGVLRAFGNCAQSHSSAVQHDPAVSDSVTFTSRLEAYRLHHFSRCWALLGPSQTPARTQVNWESHRSTSVTHTHGMTTACGSRMLGDLKWK